LSADPTAVAAEILTEGPFTFRQRFLLWLISWIGFLAIRLIGMTLRVETSAEEGTRPGEPLHPSIFAFWHRCVFPAAHIFRNQNVAVMTSRSFDGEYIARIIERNGFIAVRGSSTRGGASALMELHRLIDAGCSAGFTIDGPRGPRYVAKPGAVLLARNTGVMIVPFYIGLQRAWVLRSWDAMMIPKPFSRALLRGSAPLFIPRETPDEDLPKYLAQLQQKLDSARAYAEANVGRVDTKKARA
jgi:lysophospholipid acyltransferase (LPLAT)-like uncharacterized protein